MKNQAAMNAVYAALVSQARANGSAVAYPDHLPDADNADFWWDMDRDIRCNDMIEVFAQGVLPDLDWGDESIEDGELMLTVRAREMLKDMLVPLVFNDTGYRWAINDLWNIFVSMDTMANEALKVDPVKNRGINLYLIDMSKRVLSSLSSLPLPDSDSIRDDLGQLKETGFSITAFMERCA